MKGPTSGPWSKLEERDYEHMRSLFRGQAARDYSKRPILWQSTTIMTEETADRRIDHTLAAFSPICRPHIFLQQIQQQIPVLSLHMPDQKAPCVHPDPARLTIQPTQETSKLTGVCRPAIRHDPTSQKPTGSCRICAVNIYIEKPLWTNP